MLQLCTGPVKLDLVPHITYLAGPYVAPMATKLALMPRAGSCQARSRPRLVVPHTGHSSWLKPKVHNALHEALNLAELARGRDGATCLLTYLYAVLPVECHAWCLPLSHVDKNTTFGFRHAQPQA